MSTELIRDYAMCFVGKPYVWGGNHALSGFDCSGFVLELLQAGGQWKHGLDTTAQGIFNHLRTKAQSVIDRPALGAVAFFGHSKVAITHVGYCLTALHMIEAGGGGSSTTTTTEARRVGALVRVRPIAMRADLVDVLMP